MIQVTIIGSGNVARHLIKAFSEKAEIELVQVFSRKPQVVADLVNSNKIISDYNHLQTVDVIIIAVTDDAIAEVSDQIPFKNQLVVHTSGSVAMSNMDDKNRKGVFYPLQTFSKSKAVDFKIIPICLEAENDKDYQTLETVAKLISNVIYKVNSEQRKALHVAAVFVSNFVNHLYQMGNEICTENNLSFDILKPLIQETANKILTLSPKEAQTGPAKRKDTQTINTHLSFLTDENQKEIYKLLTKSIIDHGKKL
ncbi:MULTISPECIES: Rossmann-like and DUF2520 domain-containing protein [unclassified Flavobacterium]|uniref:Rossmann-like and DUF2520 domain-containing protein n=1 Tax=unclassified Flavobacterium TaxID=196869 RepID=UPI000EADFAAA|nr:MULTISPECIES: Rossmann-like and DUF2520 domain-containing protein [unclassified Flavobacterium]RKS02567.1 putative short-subunit dehydrogenase-like oxidoreductase (DUF2520 family) [Flavobacterium sp. 102]